MAFRRTRQELNKFRKVFNSLHRQLDRRLEGHYTELLDSVDAQKVVDAAQQADQQWQMWKLAVINNLESFFL